MASGPAVFTTLRVRDGHPWLWPAHVERLCAGAAHLGAAAPDPVRLLEAVGRAVGSLADARVRVTLDPGGDARVEARAYRAPAVPWTLRPVRAPWSPAEDTMRWKTTARGAYDEARREAGAADDALLVDGSGSWLETTVANVFLVMEDGSLRTPPATLQLLPGVAREAVLAAAAALDVPAREAPCGPEEAARAAECFVTNALLPVHPVALVAGVRAFPPGSVARGLRETVVRRALLPRIIR